MSSKDVLWTARGPCEIIFSLRENLKDAQKSLCPQGSFEEADGNVQGIHLLFTLTPQRRGSRDMSVGPSHTGARAPGPQVRGSREGGSSMVTRKVTG